MNEQQQKEYVKKKEKEIWNAVDFPVVQSDERKTKLKTVLAQIIKDCQPKVSKIWIEKIIATISLRCRRDKCGDIEFDGEEAEDDLREGLKEIGIEEKQ